MNKLPAAIIFDWDECLVTQGSLIKDVTEEILRAHLSEEEYSEHKEVEVITGRSMKNVFPKIFGEARWKPVQNAFYELFEKQHLEKISLLPGANAIIEYCNNEVCFTGVLSNKKGELLRKELEFLNLTQSFQSLVGSGDAEADKPDVAPMKLALTQSQLEFKADIGFGKNLWFVGDRYSDWQTAKNSGCTFVYMGSNLETELRGEQPDWAFHHLTQLLTCLAGVKLLHQVGWQDAVAVQTFGDMSPRRYTRYKNAQNESVLLMDASGQPDSVAKFINVRDHLAGLGYSVPKIIASDTDHYLLLVEDFGDRAFEDILGGKTSYSSKNKNTEQNIQENLYGLAIDFLIDLHQFPVEVSAPKNIPFYSNDTYLQRAGLIWKWYVPATTGENLSEESIEEYEIIWLELLKLARKVPETLVLRDYNRRNIFYLEDRTDLEKCGLIDFQDAMRGPITEDLLSLLSSSRKPMADSLKQAMIARYLRAFPVINHSAFYQSWDILTAHRMIRLVGLFTRAIIRDQNKPLSKYLTGVIDMAWDQLDKPILKPLKSWFGDHVVKKSMIFNKRKQDSFRGLIAEKYWLED